MSFPVCQMTEIRLSALYSVAAWVFVVLLFWHTFGNLLAVFTPAVLSFVFNELSKSSSKVFKSLSISSYLTTEIHNLARICYSLLIDCDFFGLQHLFNTKLQHYVLLQIREPTLCCNRVFHLCFVMLNC